MLLSCVEIHGIVLVKVILDVGPFKEVRLGIIPFLNSILSSNSVNADSSGSLIPRDSNSQKNWSVSLRFLVLQGMCQRVECGLQQDWMMVHPILQLVPVQVQNRNLDYSHSFNYVLKTQPTVTDTCWLLSGISWRVSLNQFVTYDLWLAAFVSLVVAKACQGYINKCSASLSLILASARVFVLSHS